MCWRMVYNHCIYLIILPCVPFITYSMKEAPDIKSGASVYSFEKVPLFSAYAYSGERTNSLMGAPIVSRTTTIFFAQLNNNR